MEMDAHLQLDTTTRLYRDGDWERFESDFLRIEREAFRDTAAGGLSAQEQRIAITRSDAVVAIMIDNAVDALIAYANTYPGSTTEKEGDTHHIDNTAIDPAYQGLGLVEELMLVLEEECQTQGINYWTQNAADYNPDAHGRTYADKVIAANRDRIISVHPHVSSWGNQKAIKMWIGVSVRPGSAGRLGLEDCE